jgi:hypothetical protein
MGIAAPPASTQNNNAAAATALQDAAKRGFPLTTSSTDVTGKISVEAVLIPAKIAKTVFGKEISNNYAIISLTISNRSSDESFIVHSIFIDYSQWLLSGSSPVAQEDNPLCLPEPQKANTTSPAEQFPNTPPGETSKQVQARSLPWCNPLQPWQHQTLGNQVDSVYGSH